VKYGGATATNSEQNQLKYSKAGGALLFTLSLALLAGAIGCRTERAGPLTPAQIHQVTAELAKAASEATPDGSVIKVRRGRKDSAGAGQLYVGVRGAGATDKLQQSLSGIATRHGLTVDPPTPTGNTSRITLRRAGTVTHQIEIEILASGITDTGPAGQGRLAILLDDLGNDRGAAEAIFALHVPITLAVLPYHPHSREIAEEARKHGCEVMLHLPMQSVANETPEQEELKPGLSRQEVENMVTKMLDAVPEADGVNNHQGSEATSNSALMDELMPVLKDAGVFYVDSRTTAATVAFDAAKRSSIKTAFRNVPFLDDVQNKEAIRKQLQIAMRAAKEKGEALAIGHPHSVTLDALREMLPEAKRQGVRLVLVSAVVH
jgi:polysaccharide deacetylase 2 family uncharacterized protein YibQ